MPIEENYYFDTVVYNCCRLAYWMFV